MCGHEVHGGFDANAAKKYCPRGWNKHSIFIAVSGLTKQTRNIIFSAVGRPRHSLKREALAARRSSWWVAMLAVLGLFVVAFWPGVASAHTSVAIHAPGGECPESIPSLEAASGEESSSEDGERLEEERDGALVPSAVSPRIGRAAESPAWLVFEFSAPPKGVARPIEKPPRM